MRKKWMYPAAHVLVWGLLWARSMSEFLDQPLKDAFVAKSIAESGISPLVYGAVFRGAYLLVFMAAFYSAYLWTGPALFPRVRYGRALLSLLGVCVAIVGSRLLVEYVLLKPILGFDNYFGKTPDAGWYIKNCILYYYTYSLIGVLLYILVKSGKSNQERAAAELSFLKSQVNPHFLFNTINDIYALVYQKSEEAPEALLKLSGILRYMLYEGTERKVPMETELTYLSDYLELQRIGAKQQSHIDFRVDGELDALRIAPLLLIAFAENIVKHGVIDDPEKPAQLYVVADHGRFTLTAVNSVKHQQKDKTGGIGLHSVRRRLELLYPGAYSLDIKEDQHTFACTLNIQLTP